MKVWSTRWNDNCLQMHYLQCENHTHTPWAYLFSRLLFLLLVSLWCSSTAEHTQLTKQGHECQGILYLVVQPVSHVIRIACELLKQCKCNRCTYAALSMFFHLTCFLSSQSQWVALAQNHIMDKGLYMLIFLLQFQGYVLPYTSKIIPPVQVKQYWLPFQLHEKVIGSIPAFFQLSDTGLGTMWQQGSYFQLSVLPSFALLPMLYISRI